MSGVALFEMASQYRQLLNTLSDGDFDLTTIQDTIEASGLVDDISSKAVGVEMVARTIEVHVPAIEAEIERLTALKKQRQNAAKGLRDYLKANMIATGITKIEAPLFKISLRANPPSVDVYEPGLIPASYMTQPATPLPVPNKALIAADIKAGKEIAGARLVTSQRLAVA